MAQMTLKEAENAIVTNYMAWLRRGVLEGQWVQKGVFNFRGAAGIGKTELLLNVDKRVRYEIQMH